MNAEREQFIPVEKKETLTNPEFRRSSRPSFRISSLRPEEDISFEAPKDASRLTIIIVNFNTKNLLASCLGSLFEDGPNNLFRVCVVDNGSTDGSSEMVLEKCPGVELIANDQNLGFSKANNLVLEKLETEYVLLVNPDVLVSPKTIETMVNFMDVNSNIGVLGPKLVRPDGSLDPGSKMGFASVKNVIARKLGLAKVFPKSHSLAGYHLRYLGEDEISQVDAVAGACMMIRKAVVETTGILDEAFFLGCEDLDYCYRVARTPGPNQEPYQVVYCPKAEAIHLGRQTRQKFPVRSISEFHKSAWRLYQKYQAENHSAFYNEAIRIGIILTAYLRIGMALTKRLYQRKKL